MRRMQVDDYVIIAPTHETFPRERGRIVLIGHGEKCLIEFDDLSRFWIPKVQLMPDLDKMEPVLYDDFSKRMKHGL